MDATPGRVEISRELITADANVMAAAKLLSGLVAAHCNELELLELAKEALDQFPRLVDRSARALGDWSFRPSPLGCPVPASLHP